MGQKRSPQLAREVLKLSRAGMSVRDIEAELSRRAAAAGRPGTGPSKSLVAEIVRDAKRLDARAGGAAERPAPVPEPATAPPSSPEPAAAPVPVDPVVGEMMSPEEFATWLAVQLRTAQLDADACRKKNDQPGASRAMRLAAQLAALLSKAHARSQEDGETIRVKISDVGAAASRARSKLHDLAARLAADRGG